MSHCILAQLVSTPDSILTDVDIVITEVIDTWGRGYHNTIHYKVEKETRVPKNCFKIIMFTAGVKPGDLVPDLNKPTFYIATKATHGIKVNGVVVWPNKPLEPQGTLARYWGELKHGDIIDAWSHSTDKKNIVRFA